MLYTIQTKYIYAYIHICMYFICFSTYSPLSFVKHVKRETLIDISNIIRYIMKRKRLMSFSNILYIITWKVFFISCISYYYTSIVVYGANNRYFPNSSHYKIINSEKIRTICVTIYDIVSMKWLKYIFSSTSPYNNL